MKDMRDQECGGGAGEGEEVCGACVSFMSAGAARTVRQVESAEVAAGPDGYTRVCQLVCKCYWSQSSKIRERRYSVKVMRRVLQRGMLKLM